jgi:capsular polysaccharide transport system permease protein
MTEISANPQAEDGAGASAARVDGAGYATATPLQFQYRVLKAIILREMSHRHGQYRLGYLISLLLPIVGIVMMLVMFGFRGKVVPSAFPLSVFIVTGYPLWQCFQGLYSKVLGTAGRGDPLLMFPQITQLDIIISHIVLDFATNTVIFTILCIGCLAVFHADGPADPLGVLFCYWGCMWMGAAVGLILCGLQRAAPLAVQFLNTFLRLGMWFSGVLYSVNRLPSWLWPYLKWNPILHLIEGCRTLWNPGFIAPIFDPGYVITLGFILTTLGFVVERLTRRLVE